MVLDILYFCTVSIIVYANDPILPMYLGKLVYVFCRRSTSEHVCILAIEMIFQLLVLYHHHGIYSKELLIIIPIPSANSQYRQCHRYRILSLIDRQQPHHVQS